MAGRYRSERLEVDFLQIVANKSVYRPTTRKIGYAFEDCTAPKVVFGHLLRNALPSIYGPSNDGPSHSGDIHKPIFAIPQGIQSKICRAFLLCPTSSVVIPNLSLVSSGGNITQPSTINA